MAETKKVTSTVDILKDKDDKRTIEVEVFETTPVYAKREYSRKMNLGNYNSFEAQIGVAMPCYREELTEVNQTISDWVKNNIQDVIKNIKSNANKGD